MTPELLEEFKELYRAEFGEDLSEEETLRRAQALISLFRAIYRPIPAHKLHVYKRFQRWYKERNTYQAP
ncbi:MAG: hypothetical protein WEA09_02355 [Gemmatimonadota bacterium]